MRTSSLFGGLTARSDSSRAISRSISRCLRWASRMAVSALATSSETAAKAARHSVSGRASPFSPNPAGDASAKRSANLRRAPAASIAPCQLARSSFSASMRLSISERLTGGTGRGGFVSIDPIVSLAPPSPSTRSEDGSSVSGKSFATSVVSPAGRSSAMTRVTLAPSGYTVTASTAEVTSRSAAQAGIAAKAARTTRLAVTRWFLIVRMNSSPGMISSEPVPTFPDQRAPKQARKPRPS